MAGAETITTVYVIKGVQELLLGLRDTQTLGILTIRPDGNMVRMSTDPLLGEETRGRQTLEQVGQCMEGTTKRPHAGTRPMEERLSSWDPRLKCGAQGSYRFSTF